MSETRTVHFKVDPALSAYLEWLESERLEFDLRTFDLFASGYRAAVARAAALEAERDQYRAAVAAADDLARVLEQEVMPRYMEMISAFSLGDSVVDPMARQSLDAYRDARAALAGQPAADGGGGF